MNRIATILAFLLSTGCPDPEHDGGTSSSTTGAPLDSTDGHSSTSGKSSTSDETSTGEVTTTTSTSTASTGEEVVTTDAEVTTSTSTTADDGSTTSHDTTKVLWCLPVVDGLGQPVGTACEVCFGVLCCWMQEGTQTCLDLCHEMPCDEESECRDVPVVAGAGGVSLCWPE